MDLKDILMGLQLVVSLVTLGAIVFGAGRFIARIEEGLGQVRSDLEEHTAREEKRFDEVRGKFGELTTTQATHGTRLQHLEAGGGK